MTDFTKEELKDISSWLSEIHHDSFDDVGYMIKKIQSLIDNYCAHQERVASFDENGHMVVQCGRCDTVLWHEKD